MELFIETLTGTAFELRVSPFETVLSVKAKIQRLEGIPISQQHLIWQSLELDDDYCLHDYGIHDGATLKLVLAMRGGPINTRRVALEDPTLREMADYMEANRDELLDKLPNNRQVTLLVYREGDQLNFFRVVDRGDGTLTPLSESYSGTSVYNLYDDEEEEGSHGFKKEEENDKMKEKMKSLRAKMENLTVGKKPKVKKKSSPHPPSGRPRSRSRHHFAASAGKTKHHLVGPYDIMSKNYVPLPPVNQTNCKQTVMFPMYAANVDSPVAATSQLPPKDTKTKTTEKDSKTTSSNIPKWTYNSSQSKEDLRPKSSTRNSPEELELLLKSGKQSSLLAKTESSLEKTTMQSYTVPRKRDGILETVKEALPLQHESKLSSSETVVNGENINTDRKLLNCNDAINRPHTSSKRNCDRKQGILLESLTTQEARGLLRQASLERLGSSKIPSFGRNSSKSRSGYTLSGTGERVYTPESRMSGRLRRSAGREGCISPRLPPVKLKKKNVKRCFICAKKTGLATSYQCRCGNNFCASHRYAEAHSCTFDYKSEGRKLIEQGNPVISAPKLPKI